MAIFQISVISLTLLKEFKHVLLFQNISSAIDITHDSVWSHKELYNKV